MGYKNKKEELVYIHDFINCCGLFGIIEENGGYGCKSKSKSKSEPGLCYDFDCPLAYRADRKDIERFEPREAGNFSEGDWMIQYKELCKKA